MKTPSWATTIWHHDGLLYLDMPSTTSIRYRHTIVLSSDIEGLTKALALIKARHESSRIGEAGEPTQQQIDKKVVPLYDPKMVRRPQPKITEEMRSKAQSVLRKVGLI
jgi:hypothetical protein